MDTQRDCANKPRTVFRESYDVVFRLARTLRCPLDAHFKLSFVDNVVNRENRRILRNSSYVNSIRHSDSHLI